MREVIPDSWTQELEDLKCLNRECQIETKVVLEEPVRIVFAEEELLMRQQIEMENSILEHQEREELE